VDGNTIAEGDADDFGYETSYDIGNCGESCIPLKLEMSDFGDEIAMHLYDANSWPRLIWENSEFSNNSVYQYDACLDPNGCAELEIWHSASDGYVCG
jgi:hypothetical protein